MAARKKTSRPTKIPTTTQPGADGPHTLEYLLRLATIERAKLEWESTVDALASLVCLVDLNGKVLRANRAVEDWSLGKVSLAIGKSAHALLHPTCRNTACDFLAFLTGALRRIAAGDRAASELRVVINHRSANLTIMPMRRAAGQDRIDGQPLAVVVANDLSALSVAQDALEKLNVELEARVRSRTQALADANRELNNEVVLRVQTEHQLRDSRDELKALSNQLIRAQESERRRIAQELHDSVGQSLSSVKYTVERAVGLIANPGRESVLSVLNLAVRRIQETAQAIRVLSNDLRPPILDDLGVASALRWFGRDFGDSYPGLTITTAIEVEDRQVPDRLTTTLFRCVQELLNNVAKHARADAATVSLTLDEAGLRLRVEDNGVGISPPSGAPKPRGSGMRNLKERAQMTGGQFSVRAAPLGGLIAELLWPLHDDPERRTIAVARKPAKRRKSTAR